MEFGYNWPSGFIEKVVLRCRWTTPEDGACLY